MRINPYLILTFLVLFFGWKIGQSAVAQVERAQAQRAAAIELALSALD
jgi:hypothetical protein